MAHHEHEPSGGFSNQPEEGSRYWPEYNGPPLTVNEAYQLQLLEEAWNLPAAPIEFDTVHYPHLFTLEPTEAVSIRSRRNRALKWLGLIGGAIGITLAAAHAITEDTATSPQAEESFAIDVVEDLADQNYPTPARIINTNSGHFAVFIDCNQQMLKSEVKTVIIPTTVRGRLETLSAYGVNEPLDTFLKDQQCWYDGDSTQPVATIISVDAVQSPRR